MIAGANVVLDDADAGQLWGRTDAGGIFSGRTQTGPHILFVAHKGYRMKATGMGKTIAVAPDVENDATVEMLPRGVLAGRVVDQYGDPVRNAIVRTEDKRTVGPGAHSEYYESYSTATTDDRGEYRIADVEPGAHYLAAEYASRDEQRNATSRTRFEWPETAASRSRCWRNHSFGIRRAVKIEGRFVNGQGAAVRIERSLNVALHSRPMVQTAPSEGDGSFKIAVLPGKYVLYASDKTGKVSKPLAIEAGDKDISGVELNLDTQYEIRGRPLVDGHASIDYSKLLLNFGGMETPRIQFDGSGTFQTRVLPNHCRGARRKSEGLLSTATLNGSGVILGF